MPAYVCRQRAFHAGRIVEPGEIVIADSCPGPWAEGVKEPKASVKAPAKGSGDRKRESKSPEKGSGDRESESKSPEKGSETAEGQQAGPVDPESIV